MPSMHLFPFPFSSLLSIISNDFLHICRCIPRLPGNGTAVRNNSVTYRIPPAIYPPGYLIETGL